MKIRILLLASNPKNTTNLRLSEEFRDIKESIKLSDNRYDFEVFEGYAVRAKDLRRLMLEKSPHIIHYSGHGETGGILLENDEGNIHEVEGHILEKLFSLFDTINCIVLNSCYSAKQANSLRSVVPYIIGMKKSIKDESAIDFSIGFYDAIGSKRTIEDAFKFGVNAINLHENENISRSLDFKEEIKENIPVLIKGNIDRELPDTKKISDNSTKIKKYNIMLYSIVSISIVLIVMVILSLISPKEKADTVEIPYSPDNIKILNRVFEKDYRNPLEAESNFGVKIEYPEITGLKTNELEQKINEKIKSAAKLYTVQDEEDLNAIVTYKIKYRWRKYLEIYFDYWLYHDGSAHQISLNKSLVLNLNNGEHYELKDLFRSGYENKLTEIILKYLNEIKYEDHFFGKPCSNGDESRCYIQIKGNENYSYNGQYLYIYFSQYEIAASYLGPVTVKIELDKMKKHINPNGPIAFLL